MNDLLDLVPIAGGSAGLGVGAALLGKAALEWVRSRQPGSVRPPSKLPSPAPPPRCGPDVERQVGELHEHLLRREEDGGLVLLRTMRDTARNTADMREILSEIRDSMRLPREPAE